VYVARPGCWTGVALGFRKRKLAVRLDAGWGWGVGIGERAFNCCGRTGLVVVEPRLLLRSGNCRSVCFRDVSGTRF
jgi:hypothetical protein